MTAELLVRVVVCALIGLACGPMLAALVVRAPLGRPALGASVLRGAGAGTAARVVASLVTGLATAMIAPLPLPVVPVAVVVVLASVPLIVIDLRLHRLPDLIVLPALGVTVLIGVVGALAVGSLSRVVPMLLGGLGLFVVFYMLALLAPSALGFGDVKLAALVGSAVGYVSPGLLLVWAVLLAPAAVLSIVAERVVSPGHPRGLKSHVAFGPVMLGAVWLLYLLVAFTPL